MNRGKRDLAGKAARAEGVGQKLAQGGPRSREHPGDRGEGLGGLQYGSKTSSTIGSRSVRGIGEDAVVEGAGRDWDLTAIEEMANKRTLPSLGGDVNEPFSMRTIREAWQDNNPSLEGSKLSLVGDSITAIGELPPSLTSRVQTLYLSNNNIASLGGIDQMKGLRSLSMANNLMRYLGQLQVLGEMSVLEKLSLEGNPVSNMPFYRMCVLSLCPHLVVLDGKKVTIEERRLVSGSMGKINQHFETLRKNELKNVVLLHLASSLACNSELFDFLRPPAEEGKNYHQNLNQSTAKAFHILLVGGVYKWLQATGADNFDCVVQSLASTLHVQMLQEYSSSEKALMQSSPDSLLKHWKSVVEGCIRYQEDLSMRLISSCQVQKGGTTMQETESTAEILRVLEKLKFEELSSDREYDILYHGEPAKNRRGDNLSQSMADRYQRILRQSAMQEGLQEDLDASTQSASLAPSLPPQQSEPESPMTKTFDAGLQPEPNLATHWTDEITSPLRKAPRAEKTVRSRRLGSPARSGKKALSALESKLDFSDEHVVRFLNRSLLVDNEKGTNEEAVVLGRDIVGEWLHACASAKAMVKLDSDVGLEIRLGPSPHLQPRSTLQAKSMIELKEHVQDALTDLTISQRESYMCWSISEALQKQAGKVKTVMSVAEDKVHSKLDLYYSMLKLLDDDVAHGTQWVQSVSSLLAEVDEGKRQLSSLRESTEHSDSSRQKLVAMKEDESVKKGSLLASIHEANMAISSMSAQLFKNPNAPKKKISRVRSILDRVEEMESRSLLLIVRVFRHLRRNTVHQRHVRVSMGHMRVARLKRLRRSTFVRWTLLLHDSYKRRLVTLKAESALVRVMFGQWIVAFNSEYKIRRYLTRKNQRAQRHFFRQMESVHVSKVKAARREKKQDVVVTCFTMVRLFRAWKSYFLKSKLPLDVDAKYTLEAHAHFKRSLFRAWWQLCVDAEAEQKVLHIQFLERKDARLRARCFKNWSNQFRARNLVRYKLCVMGLMGLRGAIRRTKRAKQFEKWAVEFNTQTQLFNHRHDAFLSLYFFAHKGKSTRLAAEKVRYRKKRRMVHAAWSVMSAQFTKNSRLGALVSVIVDHGSTRKLRHGFQQWHKLSKRPSLESLAAAHTYFDDETMDDLSRLEAVDLKQTSRAVPPADKKQEQQQAPSQQSLVRYRGLLLTREQVEMARLERMVDEDFCLVGTRFYNRKTMKCAVKAWSKTVSKRGTANANYHILCRKSSHRLKRRFFSRLTTSWLSNITAARLELSKDNGMAALDAERSSLLLECSNYRTQILRQQERAHYLNEKLLQVGASVETAQRNLEDTNASLTVLKSERGVTCQAISRLREESQTIKIMAEGLSTPSHVREEVDQDLKAMLNTEDMLRSHNAELLLGVETNYKRAVDIEVGAKKEQSKIKAESHAVHEVTTQQERELALIEEQIQALLAEKEEAEAHLSNANKSFEGALHDTKSRKESIVKQIVEVDQRKDDARDRYMRAQKEESELRTRVDELRNNSSTSSVGDSMSTTAHSRQGDFGETSVLSSLDHVTESRALLESALLEVAELSKRDELLSGDAFSRNLADMEEKRLNSFLVPEEQSGDESEEGHSSSFREMTASLDKINMNALELLDENRTVGQSSLHGRRGSHSTAHKKRPSVPAVSTKERTKSTTKPASKAITTHASLQGGARGGTKKASVGRKNHGKGRVESSGDGAEPTSEEISEEISSISERLKQRLSKEW